MSAGPARGPPQLRVARARSTWKTSCGSRRRSPSPGCSSATTSPSATATASPISLMEFLYPLLQGTRLGRDPRRRRARRHRPALQPARRAATCSSRPARSRRSCSRRRCSSASTACKKMSKSLGNYVGIAEPPAEQFGKLMSIPDAVLPMYFQYATAWPPERDRRDDRRSSRSGALHPNAAKRLLGRTVVDLYHGAGAGAAAEAEFDRVFKEHAGARPTCPTSPSPAPGDSCSPTRWLQPGWSRRSAEATRAIEAGQRCARRRAGDGDDRALAAARARRAGREAQVGADRAARIARTPPFDTRHVRSVVLLLAPHAGMLLRGAGTTGPVDTNTSASFGARDLRGRRTSGGVCPSDTERTLRVRARRGIAS